MPYVNRMQRERERLVCREMNFDATSLKVPRGTRALFVRPVLFYLQVGPDKPQQNGFCCYCGNQKSLLHQYQIQNDNSTACRDKQLRRG